MIAGLTGAADARERDKEFAADVSASKKELLSLAHSTVNEAKTTIATIDEQQLMAIHEIQGFSVTGLKAIFHTTTHFVGHTHQIILLSRIQLGESYKFAWSPEQGRDQLPI